VHKLEIKVSNITDARCNHETYQLLYLAPGLTKTFLWSLHYIYLCCMALRTNSNFCLIEIGFYNRSGKCFLRGTD